MCNVCDFSPFSLFLSCTSQLSRKGASTRDYVTPCHIDTLSCSCYESCNTHHAVYIKICITTPVSSRPQESRTQRAWALHASLGPAIPKVCGLNSYKMETASGFGYIQQDLPPPFQAATADSNEDTNETVIDFGDRDDNSVRT